MVGVGNSVHFAGYRSHVARAEDIINANAQRTFLVGVAQLAETTLQKAVAHAPTNFAIHIRQRNGVEIAYSHYRVRRLVNRRFHRLRLLLAQLTGSVELLAEGALLEMADGQCVQLQIFFHEAKTLQVIHNESDGVFLDNHIALAADVILRLVGDSLLVDERVARENHIAKLPTAVVSLEIVVGIGVLAHGLAQLVEGHALRIFIHPDLLQADDICVLLVEVGKHLLGLLFIAHTKRMGVVGQHLECVGEILLRLFPLVRNKKGYYPNEQE